MDAIFNFSAEEYINIAQKMLEKKDLLGFVENITISVLLSQNEKKMLTKATFLRIQGLMAFNQHQKLLEYVDEALSYSTGESYFKLKELKGKAKGYLGDLEDSKRIFKELLNQTEDINLLVDTYINIAWVNLTVNKDKTEEALNEAKRYLDIALEKLHLLANSRKWRILNNVSIYYYYKQDYDKAIENLESAIDLCSEKDLAYVYTNLAEIYLEMGDNSYVDNINEYTVKAEIIGSKYKEDIIVARAFFIRAMSELKEDQLFTALDTLYLSLEYYRQAEAYSLAFDCLVKIYKIMDDYKIDRLEHLNISLNEMFKSSPLFNKLEKEEKK